MQETTPGQYEDQPRNQESSSRQLQQQHQHQHEHQHEREREHTEVRHSASVSMSNSGSEQGSYDDDSASDASYTETYDSDAEDEQGNMTVPLQQPWSTSGPGPTNSNAANYMSGSMPSELYRYHPYHPAAGYGVASGYAPPGSQVFAPSHGRQLSHPGDAGWPFPDRRQYVREPSQMPDPQYGGHFRGDERYAANQPGAWPAAPQPQGGRRPQFSPRPPHTHAGSDEAGFYADWEGRQLQFAPYLNRTQMHPQQQLQVQYERSGALQYGQRSRVLEDYPGLERSHWLREMASTPERLEQLISQFPSLVGNIHIAPDGPGQQNPNMFSRLRVNTTLWEAEATICIVVEIDQRSVSRRCDNNMVNGTKLLNVARISRGRRDGILKGEKIRKVVKVGNMNNKGVWIPFERALDIAQREEILDSLYPLFVNDLNPLLFSPSNHSRLKQMLLKGAQKNPEFRRWFDGIPPVRSQAQPPLLAPPAMQQHTQQHTQQQQPPPQLHVQAPPRSYAPAHPAYQGPQGPQGPSEPPQAGPGPSSTARTHRRTRSQQHQQHQRQNPYRSSAVQKQPRPRHSRGRSIDAYAAFAEGQQFATPEHMYAANISEPLHAQTAHQQDAPAVPPAAGPQAPASDANVHQQLPQTTPHEQPPAKETPESSTPPASN